MKKICWWNLTIDEKIQRSKIVWYILYPIAIILALVKLGFIASVLIAGALLFIMMGQHKALLKKQHEQRD
ncbi:MAG: hypothetical protein MR210_08290 [Erysipelotrichaceae bacterium]|nr:hypothetical protein [Erysipelotrichaceae bacterium]MDY5251241.1 hypothetical protein [Erysipelotrichaceae bacterium]